MIYNLGVICYSRHDAAAVLVEDGCVVAAAEEERFSRKKLDSSFPAQAINFCLAKVGITPQDLAAIGYGFHPTRRFSSQTLYVVKNLPRSVELVVTERPFVRKMNGIKRDFREHLGYSGPVYQLGHHLCHAASTFLASPFAEAAILTIDGLGDWESCWWGLGQGNELTELGKIDWPQSLGHVYAAFTDYLGFQALSDEYKVMGLAAYGEPRYLAQMQEIFWATPQSYQVNLDYFNFQTRHCSPWFSPKLVECFGPALRDTNKDVPQHYRDIAASLQAQLEQVIFHLVQKVVATTGSRNLCLAGGVAMNSVANGKILTQGLVDGLYVPPCASDAGVALGAAYLAYKATTGKLQRQVLETALLGPEYDAEQILAAIKSRGLQAEVVSHPAASAAQLLATGKVIGWFQGRMEFGPRALGARSILADPRRAEMQDIVNTKIKFRERFRPFAPSALAEYASEYFDCPAPTPFMTQVYSVHQDKQATIPAVTHVDGTARVQTVSQSTNPLYWDLIHAFYQLTGVPIVLNTSFNVKGQPIVNTPTEAVDTFLNTGLDALLCGNYLVLKD
ncbi:MAG: nodulation protein [Chroococcidiopsidaceae cyanobacterium CP_BM_RX_35]|nr:nodulation protein [Chroococcidiopsidaceae cyanobacterium CP_BM_RX_35]